ncbi:mCG146204, partial [Mus musculus]
SFRFVRGLIDRCHLLKGSETHRREGSSREFLRIQDVQDREGDLVVRGGRLGPDVLPCQHARLPRARGQPYWGRGWMRSAAVFCSGLATALQPRTGIS